MPPREAAALVAELAEALQLAREHGLAHGDIKPSSVFMGDDGQPRLLDFGELELNMSSGDFNYGNPAYLAPERLRGDVDPREPRVDVYGLGRAPLRAVDRPAVVPRGRN